MTSRRLAGSVPFDIRAADPGELAVTIKIPAELIDALAEIVALRLGPPQPAAESSSPHLFGAKQAAAYLGWPKGRVVKKIRQLPHRKVDGRLVFVKAELDAYIDARPDRLSARRPW